MRVASGSAVLAAGLLAKGILACAAADDPAPYLADSSAAASTSIWTPGPPLPRPVANNAVVGLDLEGESHVYSFLGIDQSKQWDGVVNWAFRWVVGSDAWEDLPPVPGPGRLAATAEVWDGKVYLFGGYTVAEDGSESSVPTVDVFDPATDSWTTAAPMPVPVDDAISGVWRDSLIVLVSGWHNTDNVADVQFFNPRSNQWSVGTPIPGPPVFGHAGKVSHDRIVYVGGANTAGSQPRYQIEPSTWLGDLNEMPPGRVSWSALGPHPGPLTYRAASASVGDWVLFAGGTNNPYNYNGMGYDGEPAQPTDNVFAFHAPTGSWVDGSPLPEPRMDHRALAVAGGQVVLAGGMDLNRTVRAETWVASVAEIRDDLSKR